MKNALIGLFMLFGTSLYGEEARLVIRCDSALKIVINGQVQSDSGPVRGYSIDVPKNGTTTLNVFTYFDKLASSNLVIDSVNIELKEGITKELDFRKDVKEEKLVDEPKKTGPNFNLFKKETLQKPNFNGKIEVPLKKEPEVKFNKVQAQTQSFSSGGDCSTGQCSVRR